MILCSCPRPVRGTVTRDRLRCAGCGGWTPPTGARGHSIERLRVAASDLTSRLAGILEDAPTVEHGTYGLRRRGGSNGIRSGGPSDPTGSSVADPQRERAAAFWKISCALVQRAVVELRLADEAMGEAKYALDPGPVERPEGVWYPKLEPDAELERQKEFQAKRIARGEVP